MGRPLRFEYADAWYHVMDRGVCRQDIFLFRAHYEKFVSLLQVIGERFGVEVHAYALMTNHYHLLMHTPEPNLSRAVRHLNGVFAQFFNATTGRDGPIFRDRYKAVPVERSMYWRYLSRYIHRNPLEAGLVRRPDEYRWSSYRAYVGIDPRPTWLRTDSVLQEFTDISAYRAFVETPVGEKTEIAQHFTTAPKQWLGSVEFIMSLDPTRPPKGRRRVRNDLT